MIAGVGVIKRLVSLPFENFSRKTRFLRSHLAKLTATATRSTSESETMADLDLASMRAKYHDESSNFTEDKLASLNPFVQFKLWMEEASRHPKIEEGNAMCISTVAPDGRPSSRMVLLKGFSEETGFRLFTNYNSRKATELLANPHAALMFYWEPLHRSVRVEGVASKIPAAESDAYFHSRPKASQIGAIVSDQSKPIESRGVLTKKNAQLEAEFLLPDAVEAANNAPDAATANAANDGGAATREEPEIPRPDWWGGFDIVPESIEFWQGQSNRIHDRIIFYAPHAENLKRVPTEYRNPAENGWIYCRLSP